MPFRDFVEINPKVELKRGLEYPFIEMAIVTPGRRYIRTDEKRVYSGGGSKFSPRDILFARITPCLENGKICQFIDENNQNGFGSTEFFIFRAKPGISDPAFVYYLVSTETIRKPAEKSMSGASGRQRADLSSIQDIMIDVYPLPIQRKIAAILSAYDDLIENNTRRIKILEEMAQAIYREWFVHFRFPGHESVRMVESELGLIPEGWEVKNLFEIAEVTYGFPFKSNLFTSNPTNKPVIRIRNIPNDYTDNFTNETVSEKFQVKNGDLLIGMDGDFHMGKWAGGIAYLNQRIVRLRPKIEISPYYLFLALQKPIHFFGSTITGTTVAHLSDKDLKSINLMIPGKIFIKKINENLDFLFKFEILLKIKNANLRRTRDLLLPKLISGELDVSELDITIPEENT
ncbi:MAG TPA: restriction endonuclease subunit S [Methanolinea sp.]|nr:restriction endonuclease subunit S [Methanolinea sp.]